MAACPKLPVAAQTREETSKYGSEVGWKSDAVFAAYATVVITSPSGKMVLQPGVYEVGAWRGLAMAVFVGLRSVLTVAALGQMRCCSRSRVQ